MRACMATSDVACTSVPVGDDKWLLPNNTLDCHSTERMKMPYPSHRPRGVSVPPIHCNVDKNGEGGRMTDELRAKTATKMKKESALLSRRLSEMHITVDAGEQN